MEHTHADQDRMTAAGRAGLAQRIHAALLARGAGRHERSVARRKRALLADVSGTVLEVGPGAGPNLAYYPAGIRWIGVEPNLFLHPHLRRAAADHGIDAELPAGTAEALPAADASVDVVVATLVLCSVDDPSRALAEVRRVLRPGGRFHFLEHVAAPKGTGLRRLQGWLRPISTRLADGCYPDRDTAHTLAAAGFARLELEPFDPSGAGFAPHIIGTAFV